VVGDDIALPDVVDQLVAAQHHIGVPGEIAQHVDQARFQRFLAAVSADGVVGRSNQPLPDAKSRLLHGGNNSVGM